MREWAKWCQTCFFVFSWAAEPGLQFGDRAVIAVSIRRPLESGRKQLGADFASPVTPVCPPTGDAEIIMSVDDMTTQMPVVVEKSEAGRISLGCRMVP
jgi:hypothetical protein